MAFQQLWINCRSKSRLDSYEAKRVQSWWNNFKKCSFLRMPHMGHHKNPKWKTFFCFFFFIFRATWKKLADKDLFISTPAKWLLQRTIATKILRPYSRAIFLSREIFLYYILFLTNIFVFIYSIYLIQIRGKSFINFRCSY